MEATSRLLGFLLSNRRKMVLVVAYCPQCGASYARTRVLPRKGEHVCVRQS